MYWETIGTVVLCFVISYFVASNRIHVLQVELNQWREQFGESYCKLLDRLDRMEGKQ